MIPQDLAQLAEPRRGARFRDEWLTHVAVLVRPWFSVRGYEIPLRLRIGVGALAVNSRTVGVYFDDPDRDGYRHITISPFIDDPVTVALVLLHELIHAVMPADEVHGARFQAAASAIGFQPPFTRIHPDEALRRHMETIVRRVGPYPHRAPRGREDSSVSASAATRDFEDRDDQPIWIVIYGPGGTVEGEAEISCRDVRSAIMLAASTASPFGHGLRSSAGFIGRFEQALSAP